MLVCTVRENRARSSSTPSPADPTGAGQTRPHPYLQSLLPSLSNSGTTNELKRQGSQAGDGMGSSRVEKGVQSMANGGILRGSCYGGHGGTEAGTSDEIGQRSQTLWPLGRMTTPCEHRLLTRHWPGECTCWEEAAKHWEVSAGAHAPLPPPCGVALHHSGGQRTRCRSKWCRHPTGPQLQAP